MNIFCSFYCRNLIRGHLVTTWEEKTVEKMTLNFFLTVHFHVFFEIFTEFDVISQKVSELFEQFKDLWALETWGKSLRHCFGTYYWTMHCHKFSKIKNTKLLITFLQCEIKNQNIKYDIF
jgi:hypothetical protein